MMDKQNNKDWKLPENLIKECVDLKKGLKFMELSIIYGFLIQNLKLNV